MIPHILATVVVLASGPEDGRRAHAAMEPRLAILTGLKCSACHVNRSGGGARTDFGSVYAQTRLPIKTEGYQYRNRAINDWISVGADLRAVGSFALTDATPRSSFETEKANVYVEAQLIQRVLTLYIDETIGPARAGSREVFGLLGSLPMSGYAKFGKFITPYGLRIVDDLEFIRDRTGFNFRTPDQGVEIGIEPGPFSVFLAMTNGEGGGAEGNNQKQYTGSAAWISRRIRLGASASTNQTAGTTRKLFGGFGGLNVGNLAVLGEVDRIETTNPAGMRIREIVAFGEGNLLLRRGVNAKVTYGYHDRNTAVSQDQRIRMRVGVEVFPIPLLQASGYLTILDDIPQARAQQDRVSVELHFFF